MNRLQTLAAGGLAVAVAVGAACGSDDTDTADRQAEVAERGEQVMPFDLEASTHHFTTTPDGGIQQVVAIEEADDAEVEGIRDHLHEEAGRFTEGDFSDPATIHGHDMPGLEQLADAGDALTVTYRELPRGAELTYVSEDPEVIDAIHRWFDAQLADHGDHATRGAADRGHDHHDGYDHDPSHGHDQRHPD